jgi:hypothetical protein
VALRNSDMAIQRLLTCDWRNHPWDATYLYLDYVLPRLVSDACTRSSSVKLVIPADIADARPQGAIDMEIYDAVLFAADRPHRGHTTLSPSFTPDGSSL